MKKTTIIFITLAFFAISCNQAKTEKYLCTNSLNLFTIQSVNILLHCRDWDNDRGVIIPLSAIDRLSEHPDSLSIPRFVSRFDWSDRHFSELSDEERRLLFREDDERRFRHLYGEYRRRFLERTGISETDSMFVSDLENNALLAFEVRELPVAAVFSPPTARTPYPFPATQYQRNYRIGFDMNDVSDLLWHYFFYSYHVMVYVGEKNPFVGSQIRKIQWQRIHFEDFPLEKSNLQPEDIVVPHLMDYLTRRNAFLYESENYLIFVQNLYHTAFGFKQRRARHLLIIDKRTDNVLFERMFRSTCTGFIDDIDSPPAAFEFNGFQFRMVLDS